MSLFDSLTVTLSEANLSALLTRYVKDEFQRDVNTIKFNITQQGDTSEWKFTDVTIHLGTKSQILNKF